jgi:rhamnosyltransferase
MKLKCAVLLATYNGEKYILEQVASILNQDKVDITIFVSDDNSSDTTLEQIKKLENENIILLPVVKRMGSAAQNFFRLIRDVDFSEYSYIALSDQDDIWFLDKLTRAISAIESKELAGYASNVTAFWKSGKTVLVEKSGTEKRWDYLFGSAGPGCTIVLTKETMESFKELLVLKKEQVRKIDLHHDWLIYAYIRANGLKWWVDPTPSMFYRQHEGNELGANSGYKALVNRWKKGRGGWYGEEILRIADICGKLNTMPMKYMITNNYIDKVFLATKVFSLRRKKLDAFVLALMFLVPGFKIKRN